MSVIEFLIALLAITVLMIAVFIAGLVVRKILTYFDDDCSDRFYEDEQSRYEREISFNTYSV